MKIKIIINKINNNRKCYSLINDKTRRYPNVIVVCFTTETMAEYMQPWTLQDIESLLAQSEYEEIPNVGQPVSPPRPSTSTSRFNPVNNEEVANFITGQKNVNTQRKTDSDVRLFKEFCRAQNEHRDIETLSTNELDVLFGNFIVSIKKADGNDYEPSTIRGFMSSMDRYLKNKNCPHQINKCPLFPHSNNAIKAKMTSLKSQGLGNRPNEADELTDADIDKLFEAGQLGHETPQQIINLLHLSFSLLFGMRGGVEQRNLKWGDIELLCDEDEDEYLSHIRERQTKTRVGTDPKNTRKFKPKAWANSENKERCPVEAYKIYKQQRPHEMMNPDAPFFLGINALRSPNSQQPWFKNQPMGKNHIYKIVKTMKTKCESLNDGRKLTNHSVRKHLLQKCNDLGMDAAATVQISGHKNLQSVNSYSKLNEPQQKQIAGALMNTKKTPQSLTQFTPSNSKQNMSPNCSQIFHKQSANSMMSSVFNGTTHIAGGTFYFGSLPENPAVLSPPSKKFKRIRAIVSDSESD